MSNTPVHSAAPLSPAAIKRHKELVRQTEKWVAQSFYGTLLKQMRDDPFKSDMFDGGTGGRAFAGMYDQQLADRMSRGAAPGLVNSIVQKIEGRKASERYQLQSRNAASDAALKVRQNVTPIG